MEIVRLESGRFKVSVYHFFEKLQWIIGNVLHSYFFNNSMILLILVSLKFISISLADTSVRFTVAA